MDGVTFCFQVTKDLAKESIWREWFADLKKENIKYRVLTHCSNPENIKSPWLKCTLIPREHLRPTSWQFHTHATLSLYEYATNMTNSCWYSLNSESCVPIISAKKFAEMYNSYKNNTIMKHGKIWWNPLEVNRANLKYIPADFHCVNQEWIMLCKEDLDAIVSLSKKDTSFTNILLSAPAADESLVSVFLKRINNFKNVIDKYITLVDWKRSPNGNNPYTFKDWTDEDTKTISEFMTNNDFTMFLRKVDKDASNDVLLRYIRPNGE